MAVARGCERLEGRLYEAVLSLGRAGLFLASAGERAERGLFKIVLCVGRVSLRVATYVQFGDERRIDGLIFALVAAVRALGALARSLQSGLIHHSLAISAVAIAVTLAVLLFCFIDELLEETHIHVTTCLAHPVFAAGRRGADSVSSEARNAYGTRHSDYYRRPYTDRCSVHVVSGCERCRLFPGRRAAMDTGHRCRLPGWS